MGQTSCTRCNCSQAENELDLEIKEEPAHPPRQEHSFPIEDTSIELDLLSSPGHLKSIVAIQAFWRGYQVRKLYAYVFKSPRRKLFKESSEAVYSADKKASPWPVFGVQSFNEKPKYKGSWLKNKVTADSFRNSDTDKMIESKDSISLKHTRKHENGKGLYLHPNGDTYEGDWKYSKQDGFGQETWVDGSTYTGFYKNGKKHGFGSYLWSDGSWYLGNWYENRISGRGSYTWFDGRKYEGEWQNNNMHGFGVYTWKDGRMYEGEYRFDKKHGKGSYTWIDGKRYEGGWKNGRQHGDGKLIFPNGECKSGFWHEGKRTDKI